MLTGVFATPADAATLAPALRLGMEIMKERGVGYSESAEQVAADFDTCRRVMKRRAAPGAVDAKVDSDCSKRLTAVTMDSGGSWVTLSGAEQLVGKSRQSIWKRLTGESP